MSVSTIDLAGNTELGHFSYWYSLSWTKINEDMFWNIAWRPGSDLHDVEQILSQTGSL